jgi:tetratricopeptide (TPR) repeat protein
MSKPKAQVGKRPADAQSAQQSAGLDSDSEDGKDLMLYACLERGRQVAEGLPRLGKQPTSADVTRFMEPVREALTAWSKAPMASASTPLQKEMAQAIRGEIEQVSVRTANMLRNASEAYWKDKRWTEIRSLLDAGIDLLKQAMGLTSTDTIKSTLAVFLADRGHYHIGSDDSVKGCDHGIQDLEAALKLTPNDVKLRGWVASAYNKRGCQRKGNASTGDFSKAIELNGGMALYYVNRGISYLEEKGPSSVDRALDDFTKAFRMEPSDDTKNWLAIALNLKGVQIWNAATNPYDRQQAKEFFKMAVELEPGNATYRKNLNG